MRAEIRTRNGVVATSQPLAAQAGVQMLREGGTSADAAVAGAAVLAVVEPNSAGPGGDLFALYWSGGRLHGLNASGWAPAGDPLVTVPGAVDGWARLHERFGRLPFARVLEPAAELAEQGFVRGRLGPPQGRRGGGAQLNASHSESTSSSSPPVASSR